MAGSGRKGALWWGLLGAVVIMALLTVAPFLRPVGSIMHGGMDLMTRLLARPDPACRRVAIVYIDQKSLDFFRRHRQIGWPWPRDAYALMVDYLTHAGAKAVVFDAVFSEPSVYKTDYDDDNTFAQAMKKSGRVFQTLIFHPRKKGGRKAATTRTRLVRGHGLKVIDRRSNRPPPFKDVTTPIPRLIEAAAGLGAINFDPDPDGVARRTRLVYDFDRAFLPALSLAVFAGIRGVKSWQLTDRGLIYKGGAIPLERGMFLIRYFGGEGVFESASAVAVIQSALDLKQKRKPLIDPALFKDKIVFVGAKAAGLYDLRTTPVSEALPGVELHATVLANLLSGRFLRPAPEGVRVAMILMVCALVFALALKMPSLFLGGLANLALAAVVVLICIVAFKQNVWLDFSLPLVGMFLVNLETALLRYTLEGHEKRFLRRAFSQYLAPEVVERVASHPETLRLGGVKQELTVFFSDIARFTSISEALPPEELVHLLNMYLTRMTEIIMGQGGTVDKYEGDAIMAFWGAPVEMADHAVRACRAALMQRTDLKRFREELKARGLPQIRVRWGLSTGPMIVGNMGSDERFDYTVMGDTVNLGARLEGANKAYGSAIMINERGRLVADGEVEFRELDFIRVVGKRRPIRIFEVMAMAGEMEAEALELRALFEQGLDTYRRRHFSGAHDLFLAALDIDPDDGPSGVFAERCQVFKNDPPPSDWDGVFEMKSK